VESSRSEVSMILKDPYYRACPMSIQKSAESRG
jgi:hypothetical protein